MAFATDIQAAGNNGIATRIAAFAAATSERFAAYKLYRATFTELNELSDRELNDLGLSRSAIKGIALEAAYGA